MEEEGFLVLDNVLGASPSCFQRQVLPGGLLLPVGLYVSGSSWSTGAFTAYLFLLLLNISYPYFCLPKLGLRGLLHIFKDTVLLVLSETRLPYHSSSCKCKKARNFQL